VSTRSASDCNVHASGREPLEERSEQPLVGRNLEPLGCSMCYPFADELKDDPLCPGTLQEERILHQLEVGLRRLSTDARPIVRLWRVAEVCTDLDFALG